jgi:phosphoacetylglucosamine mutase
MRLDDPTILNDKSGADFVQKELLAPTNITAADVGKVPQRNQLHFVSWDGDVDRVVYFYFNDQDQFELVDGDKMLTLLSLFFKQQFDVLEGILDSSLTIGTVQTAYANGGSTQYLQNVLKVPVSCVPTGVKFLHHQAKEFDVGVYFEANGHGTVLFSRKCRTAIQAALEHPNLTPEQRTAALRLQGASQLLHPTVGDAIADMLAIEGCLALLNWDLEKWNSAYSDLPSRQLKASVPDPKKVKPVWDETRITEPAALQTDIDEFVKKYSNGRAFVRPSGTEPIVRVYAEAASRSEADSLAQEVLNAIVKRVVEEA